jgi:hypothetical protein
MKPKVTLLTTGGALAQGDDVRPLMQTDVAREFGNAVGSST